MYPHIDYQSWKSCFAFSNHMIEQLVFTIRTTSCVSNYNSFEFFHQITRLIQIYFYKTPFYYDLF